MLHGYYLKKLRLKKNTYADIEGVVIIAFCTTFYNYYHASSLLSNFSIIIN